MIFIYNCYGGTHSSSLASAVHLGKLRTDRTPTREDILNVDRFNKLTYKDMGSILFRGTDSEGNRVYTVGRGTSRVLIPCLCNLIEILHSEYGFDEKIIFSNMSPTVPPVMTCGGFFSRGLKLHFIGVPLLVLGAQQAFDKVVRIVNHTRETAQKTKEQVVVLTNTEF